MDETPGRTGLIWRQNRRGEITAWIRVCTPRGRTRLLCGRWPADTITAIAKRARALRVGVDNGEDRNAATRASKRAHKALTPTVGTRLREWQLARQAAWSPAYAVKIGRLVAHEIMPTLGKRPLAEVSRAEWVGLVIAKRPTAPIRAGTLYDIISSFTNFAEAAGWIPAAPLPRKGRSTLAPKGASRERTLTAAELLAVWHGAAGLLTRKRVFIRLAILTGARESEVGGIIAGEIDMQLGRWTIPATRAKNRRSITLPLGPLALAELAAVWPSVRCSTESQPDLAGWHLLGETPGRPLATFSKLKERLDKLSGVSSWRIHDLRRTMRTGLSALGVAREVAELCLNHVSAFTPLEQTYNRHDYAAEIIAAVQLWQEHVGRIINAAVKAAAAAD